MNTGDDVFTFISNQCNFVLCNQYALSRLDICEDVQHICLLLTPTLMQSLSHVSVSDKQGRPRGFQVVGAAGQVGNGHRSVIINGLCVTSRLRFRLSPKVGVKL